MYRDRLLARNVAPYRHIGADMDKDSITKYDTSTETAKIIAKGAVPDSFTLKAEQVTHDVYCFATGFSINERDLQKPVTSAIKTKEIDVALKRIHMAEDDFFMNGGSASSATGITANGIDAAAALNTNGSITTGTNAGAWDGSDPDRDLYSDVLNAVNLMDEEFTPTYLIGKRADLKYLFQMTSAVQRQPFYRDIAPLFGKSPDADPYSWIKETSYAPSGYVYVVASDPDAFEFIVSQEIDVDDRYPKQPGGNYWIEIKEWVRPIEIHDENSIVEIAIG